MGETATPSQLYSFTSSIVNALNQGYALSISVYNSGVAHAYTLWGVEYNVNDAGNYIITKAWLTDSDDGQATGRQNTLVEKKVNHQVKEVGSTLYFDEQFGATWNYVDVMWTERTIPEPATATLSLLALTALAARRKRQ